jgi:aminoglycoside 3-N-acetyltransferase
MSGDYNRADIRDVYRALGVEAGRVVYLTSDLGKLWRFAEPGKKAVLDAHLDVLMELLGPRGTLVVPTATSHLCNTEIPFDVDATPSQGVGALSEHVRLLPGTLRSFHPFVSYAAHGAEARAIIEDASRHAFGPFTPEARMIEAGALSISAGLPITHSVSTVHQVEVTMAVPYRYTKEYLHPVVRKGELVIEPFYQHVWYRGSDVERSWNQRIVARFASEHDVRKRQLGRGDVYAYEMRDFVKSAMRMFKDDPYIWCRFPPAIRPWQQ